MHKIIYILFLLFALLNQKVKGQCSIDIDPNSLQHIVCPNGGSVGVASIIQSNYTNYWWTNLTTGQQNSNFGPGVTSVNNLNAGLYVITATDPFNSSCPTVAYSDTFEILEALPSFQFSPDQACPDLCNVTLSVDMQVAISNVNYTIFFNSNLLTLPVSINNQCGGLHTYEIFADGNTCGVETIGISQFAPMNLQANVTDQICSQPGSAEVLITGVGASALNTYCNSSPQFDSYSNIENVSIVGDNTSIYNNTVSQCNAYSDYTSFSADVTAGNSYTLNVNLGTCSSQGTAWTDLANVYVDWNIDGDFNDANELVAQINPVLSPSSHILTFTVPINATPGQCRMRIVSQNDDFQPTNSAQACDDESSYFGETEDYTLVVNGSVATPVSYLWSDGQTNPIASNLSSGIYFVTVTDANGCSSQDTAIVNVSNTQVSVSASSDQTICNGGAPSPISASVSSVGSFLWTPSNDFINASIQNPVFSSNPNSTTVYSVSFTDTSGCVVSDDVVISVNPLPSVTLTALPNPACLGDDIVLNAFSSIPVSKFRFQFNNGSWVNLTTPVWGNTSSIIFNNIQSNTDFRVKVREDYGCNTSGWSPIITVPVNLITTPLISHN